MHSTKLTIPVLSETGARFVAAARAAATLRRTRGPLLRRADRLCALGDALTIARPRDWRERARRVYGRASRMLGANPVDGSDIAALAAAAAQARAALRLARMPYRRFLRALAIAAAIASTVLFAITLALAAVSRPVGDLVFPPDLAARAAWTASSAFEGAPLTGRSASSSGPYFFHTLPEQHPWLRIDLPRRSALHEIRVYNRVDCCRERALPLNIEVPDGDGWRLICQRRAPFRAWSCHPHGLATEVIRITTPGPMPLHLKRVAIFE